MDEERRGFAGFDPLVTDLSDLPPLPPAPPPPPPRPDDKAPAAPAGRPAQGDARKPRASAKQMGGTAGIALGVCAIVFGLVRLAEMNSHNRPSYVAPKPANAPYRFTTQPVMPYQYQSPQLPMPPYNQLRPPPFPEQKPPVGQDIALSTPQLRYCLAQAARIDGSEKAVDRTSQSEIARFNALVEDYNVRCVRYRYRASEMQTLKAEVDGRRAQLEKEGAALVRSANAR